ncbi:4a-hydroxytetrahydrobiopterin dehydratase [Rhodobacteraceae bacterium]|nr:4a-hydroxytetrahydrobiopterin dehydratase [Paracoccaceae bacterium]
MASPLNHQERDALLPMLYKTGWQLVHNGTGLRKSWKFDSFAAAWGFMSQAALCAEKMDHHPDWRNVYNTLEVTLSTHSCGGLSVLDAELAQGFDAITTAGRVLDASPFEAKDDEHSGGGAPDPRSDLSDDFLD